MKILKSFVIITVVLGTSFPARADHELLGRDVIAGERLYLQHCASCHGVNLEGQPNWQTPNADGVLPAPPHDASGHTWHHDNALLFEYTKLGGAGALAARGVTGFNSGMPAYEGELSDGDIWNILAFIRSTWPKHVQANHASRNTPHD